MADKEQIINNFEKDINVPSKEQIIIDGCNVLKCRYYQYKTLKDCEMRYPESGDCEMGLLNYLFNGNLDMEKLCVDNPNCHFKQLARKTQECEGLKKENQQLRNSLSDSLMFKFTGQENETNRYRKALEEIESYFEQPCEDCYASSKCRKCIEIEIIDIINKAKGR